MHTARLPEDGGFHAALGFREDRQAKQKTIERATNRHRTSGLRNKAEGKFGEGRGRALPYLLHVPAFDDGCSEDDAVEVNVHARFGPTDRFREDHGTTRHPRRPCLQLHQARRSTLAGFGCQWALTMHPAVHGFRRGCRGSGLRTKQDHA